jgi:hypothetical protein
LTGHGEGDRLAGLRTKLSGFGARAAQLCRIPLVSRGSAFGAQQCGREFAAGVRSSLVDPRCLMDGANSA